MYREYSKKLASRYSKTTTLRLDAEMENVGIPNYSKRLERVILHGNKRNILQLWRKKNINVRAVNNTGDTVAHLVFQNADLPPNEIIEILEVFINAGVDLNIKNDGQATVLRLAMTRWNRGIVDCLLKGNAIIDVVDDEGNTLSHYFVENALEKFTKTYVNPDNDHRLYGMYYMNNVLLEASLGGKTREKIASEDERECADFVGWLLSKGFDFDAKNNKGKSALHLAIKYNLQFILPCLLRCTKDINFVNSKGRTLLHLFLKARQYSRQLKSSAFSWRYDVKIVKILLKRGVSVNHADCYGNTPIHYALDTTKFEVRIVRLLFNPLIAKVVNVNSRDKNGRTPLYMAVRAKNLRAIEYLKETGADFNVISNFGNNLFHALSDKVPSPVAEISCQEKIFDLLISQGCEVNAQNIQGRTPLHLAVRANYDVTLARKLVAHGADVNCRDNKDLTPLHLAVQYGLVNLTKLLLDNGANVNAKSQYGRPLHLAAQYNTVEMLNMLLSHKAEVNAHDSQGNTALVRALLNDRLVAVKKLLVYGADFNDISVIPSQRIMKSYTSSNFIMLHWVVLEKAMLPCTGTYLPFVMSDFYWPSIESFPDKVDDYKGVYIDSHTSLYQWLQMDPNRRYLYCRDDRLRHLAKELFGYSTLILSHYHEAKARRALLERGKKALIKVIPVYLPDICLEHILAYMNTGYLLEIIELTEESDNI